MTCTENQHLNNQTPLQIGAPLRAPAQVAHLAQLVARLSQIQKPPF